MKLTVFQSDKGDCLLLTTASGHHMLVDGGMASAYTQHVAPTLGKMRKAGQHLDVVYVSHIDDDHISGILQMLDDLVAWRVYDYQKSTHHPNPKQPQCERPPDITALWHNGFRDQVGKNAGEIEDRLSATANILAASTSPALTALAQFQDQLATSVRQALQLSRRISAGQLNIALNPDFNGKLMCVKDGHSTIQLGSAALTVVGPFPEDLSNLRDEWNAWLSGHGSAVATLRQQARKDEDQLHADAREVLRDSMIQAAEQLGGRLLSSVPVPASDLATATKVLGKRAKVTVPNLASLMFLVEEQGKTILLTGDGHCDDVLKGLQRHGKLTPGTPFRVDILKVQHHGSEHNIHKPFMEQVVADDYVFCGNGFSENPDLDVLKMLVETRVKAPGNFRLWFNCASSQVQNAGWAKHMKSVEALAKQLVVKYGAKMKASFSKTSSFSLTP